MEHPIVEKILKEGIGSVNISMLDEITKNKILSVVADRLYKQNRFIEAIEIMHKSNDIEKLIKLGDAFLSESRIELATLCFIPTKDKQRLNDVAVLCIQSKDYKLAARAYDAADNKQMSLFIQKNFVSTL